MATGPLDFDEIEKILELMREHGLAEFELEREDIHLRLRKPETSLALPEIAPPDGGRVALESQPPADKTAASDVTMVEAPILGTFYRASAPDAPPFAEVGDVVKPGDVLCIIEAMKLMNDIKSEYAGELMEIFVENGQPVQYGERLFAIRRV
jgi:acetyl-CoA carboxylase biotin carboxyl carrier protein